MGVLSNNYAQIVPGALISASYVSDIYDVLMGDSPEAIVLSGSLTISGSTQSTNGFTGSLYGTSSWAISSSRSISAVTASYAISASYINYINSSSQSDTAVTASYALYSDTSLSASYSTTASYASSATVTPSVLTLTTINDLEIDATTYDAVIITTQDADILINNPLIGAPDCKPVYISLNDDGQAHNITYGDKFKAFGISLPIVTVPGKTIAYTMIYSEFYDKWNITWMLEL